MLELRVHGPDALTADVAARLTALPASLHVLRTTHGDQGMSLVTAEIDPDDADAALRITRDMAIPPEDVRLVRLEAIGPEPARTSLGSVTWSDLEGQAGANARPIARYLMVMAVAGIIAGFGVIYRSSILIVGAMAISPDMLPVTAICTGLVLGRATLSRRALATLIIGLAAGGAVAGAMTAGLRLLDLLPQGFAIGNGGLQGLSTVNVSTPIVAFAAGIAGMLALETRASSAVGVAISVTTIPASAYLGVAIGVGELSKARGALLVLGINVSMLIAGGSAILLAQRRLSRRQRASTRSRPPTDGAAHAGDLVRLPVRSR